MAEVVRRGYLRVDLADNCNIRCIMCQAYNGMPVSAMKFLDFDTFVEQTRGEISKWDTVQLGHTAEATIHPRFADFVRYIRAEAPETCIFTITNGKTLHKFAPLLNETGNCAVQISMDSVRKETHEYIRDGSNFGRALENMAMLDPSRVRVLLAFTLMRSNIVEYGEMVDFCRERGYSMSAFPMILRSENGVVPYNLLKESLWFNLEHLRSWLKDYYGVRYEKMMGTASGASPNLDEFTCNAHYQDLSMNSAGTATLCGKLTLGSLEQHSLRDMWQSAEAGVFRLQVETDREPCMTCNYLIRCFSPSMAQLDNHFSEELVAALKPETRERIGYGRTISDDEALWYFARDLGGIFDISGGGREWVARKIIPLETPGAYRSGDPITAGSRHELHEIMVRDADSALNCQLVESYGKYNLVKYDGKYWAFPVSLGHLNVKNETDRRKPGILWASTLEDLKALCGSCGEGSVYVPPRLVESLRNYNLVEYLGKYWAIPLAFGPYDLSQPENQNRKGIRVGPSLDQLRGMCKDFPILTV